MAFLTMQGFFRTFGVMCTNFDSAFRLAVFFIPNMILYAGYMIPVFQMKRWLFWIVSSIVLLTLRDTNVPLLFSITSTLWPMVRAKHTIISDNTDGMC